LGAAWSAQFAAECERFQGDRDPETWIRVADLWARLGQPHDEAWALLRVGECQIAAGERETALAPLQRASSIARELRAEPLVAAVADLARHGRVDVGLMQAGGSH